MKRITVDEYVKLAKTTAVSSDLHVLVLGLVGETIEAYAQFLRLDKIDKKQPAMKSFQLLSDELGDVLWYVALLSDAEQIDIAHEWEIACHTAWVGELSLRKDSMEHLLLKSGIISEHFKKHFSHKKQKDKKLIKVMLTDIFAHVAAAAETIHGEDGLQVVMQQNLSKLAARYVPF